MKKSKYLFILLFIIAFITSESIAQSYKFVTSRYSIDRGYSYDRVISEFQFDLNNMIIEIKRNGTISIYSINKIEAKPDKIEHTYVRSSNVFHCLSKNNEQHMVVLSFFKFNDGDVDIMIQDFDKKFDKKWNRERLYMD